LALGLITIGQVTEQTLLGWVALHGPIQQLLGMTKMTNQTTPDAARLVAIK